MLRALTDLADATKDELAFEAVHGIPNFILISIIRLWLASLSSDDSLGFSERATFVASDLFLSNLF